MGIGVKYVEMGGSGEWIAAAQGCPGSTSDRLPEPFAYPVKSVAGPGNQEDISRCTQKNRAHLSPPCEKSHPHRVLPLPGSAGDGCFLNILGATWGAPGRIM